MRTFALAMKILLIEDEPKTAKSIQNFLTECHIEVDVAFEGHEGIILSSHHDYDVIISDVILPNSNGLDICRTLRNMGIQTPILLLSALSQPEDKVIGLQAGADDYLAKPFDFQELLARLQALSRRSSGKVALKTKLTFDDLEMDLNTLEVMRAGVKIVLTPREFALLEYLVRNHGRVIPKAEILEAVWNIDEIINTNVIEVYVNYIRNKIDKGFKSKLIHTHFGVGYVLKNEVPS